MDTAPRPLEALFDQVRALDEPQQAWTAERLEEQLAQAKGDAQHNAALKDPKYRAHVENALEEAEADYEAGRFRPVSEAFDVLEARIKAKHDL
jgi:hypothetical protein